MRYGVQGDRTTQTMIISGGDADEMTISGLDSSTNYTIEVAAVNSAGIGTYSSPITVLTNGMFIVICITCSYAYTFQAIN